MSTFLKSALGVAVMSVAMIAGMGQSNEAEARPWGRSYYGNSYRGYNNYYGRGYNTGYRYNTYRPYSGYRYNNYYGRPYGYNNFYGPRNSIGIGGFQIGW